MCITHLKEFKPCYSTLLESNAPLFFPHAVVKGKTSKTPSGSRSRLSKKGGKKGGRTGGEHFLAVEQRIRVMKSLCVFNRLDSSLLG